MRLDIITIFPAYFAPLDVSLLGKARRRGDVDVRLHDLRDWAYDRHRTVDDTPYGGGPGMVMKPEPWGEALDAVLRTPPPARAGGPAAVAGPAPDPGGAPGSAPEPGGPPSAAPEPGVRPGLTPESGRAPDAAPGRDAAGVGADAIPRNTAARAPGSPAAPASAAGHPPAAPPVSGPAAVPSPPGAPVPTPRLVVPTPSGRPFTQELAVEYAAEPWLVFACGRYEGIDARVIEDARERMPVDEVSIGDYVLAGGESAVLVIVEAVTRLLPGVLGNADSVTDDSFAPGRMASLLEGPVYTKPPTWRGRDVPEVLMSGNHAVIARWRRDQALARTAARRPELLARGVLDDADRRALMEAGFPIDRERMAH